MFRSLARTVALAGIALGSSSAQEIALVSPPQVQRTLQDFNWNITPEDGFPKIAFNQASQNSEIQFKYNFTGSIGAQKKPSFQLFQYDCNTTTADSSLAMTNAFANQPFGVQGNELELDVDVVQSTITNSPYYKDTELGKAEISFCVRVDYNYIDNTNASQSINFHETSVVISVDLTANFTLTAISVNRTAADQTNTTAKVDYPVKAYFCLDDFKNVSAPILAQGSLLQVCVKIDDDVVTDDVYVREILSFVVSQPLGPASSSQIITNTQPDPLTSKVCNVTANGTDYGICNVKTQLPSKFFVDPFPNYLQVDGIAILAFGIPIFRNGKQPTRFLRARISGLLSAEDAKALLDAHQESSSTALAIAGPDATSRRLQGTQSQFGLTVGLTGNGQNTDQQSSTGGGSAVGVAVAVVGVLAVVGLALFAYTRRRKRNVQKEITLEQTHTQTASSGYTPSISPSSLYTSNAMAYPQQASNVD